MLTASASFTGADTGHLLDPGGVIRRDLVRGLEHRCSRSRSMPISAAAGLRSAVRTAPPSMTAQRDKSRHAPPPRPATVHNVELDEMGVGFRRADGVVDGTISRDPGRWIPQRGLPSVRAVDRDGVWRSLPKFRPLCHPRNGFMTAARGTPCSLARDQFHLVGLASATSTELAAHRHTEPIRSARGP